MKKVIIGFIAGALFATAGTAAASTIIEKVTASVRTDYSVEVDGQKVVLENAPLAYKGSAYIAVREISTVIGKEVGFEDGVIKIQSPEIEVQEPTGTLNIPVETMNASQVKSEIVAVEGVIQIYRSTIIKMQLTEEEKAEKQALIEKYEQRLAELKARKAELEAQQ